MRRSRQAVIALAVAGLASAACLALIVVLANRDASGVGTATPSGPGTLQPDRGARHLAPGEHAAEAPAGTLPTSGPHHAILPVADGRTVPVDALLHAMELGDVVLAYDAPSPPAALRRLQRDVAGGPYDRALAQAGQAVVLARRPGVRGVVAGAWRRELRASGPEDPRLRAFAETWLGRGRSGG